MEHYMWSDGPYVAEMHRGGLAFMSKRTFLDVYSISFPNPDQISSVSEGLLNGNAISYCRVRYTEPLAAFVVSSTLPDGRSDADDCELLLNNERLMEQAYHDVGKGHRYVVSLAEAAWGKVIKVKITNVLETSEQGPFPLSRSLHEADAPLSSLSFHCLFVRGANRFEVAVLGAAPQSSDLESVDEWERGLESLVSGMVTTLQAETDRMLHANKQGQEIT